MSFKQLILICPTLIREMTTKEKFLEGIKIEAQKQKGRKEVFNWLINSEVYEKLHQERTEDNSRNIQLVGVCSVLDNSMDGDN